LDGDLDDNSKKDALFLNYLKHTTHGGYNITSIKLDTRSCNYFLSSPPLGGGPFSEKVLSFFNVSESYTDDFGINRALIPIYDHSGALAGYTGRDISNKLKHRKYLLIGNITAGDILYNLNVAKNTTSDYIIVVEGFKSVWRLHQYGYDNTVACMGSLMTPHQIRLLIGTLKKIVLFFDSDSPGILGTIITNNKYNLTLPLIPIISDYDRDPADLTKEETDKILGKYRTEHVMLA